LLVLFRDAELFVRVGPFLGEFVFDLGHRSLGPSSNSMNAFMPPRAASSSGVM
jgi:hypothetical protein